MRIRKLGLVSYGPFESLSGIEFEPGINLIVGPNDAGKSFLLTALRQKFDNNPHRNVSVFEDERLKQSRQRVDVEVSGREFESALLQRGGNPRIPAPTGKQGHPQYIREFLSEPAIVIAADRLAGGSGFSIVGPTGILTPEMDAPRSQRLNVVNGALEFIDVQGHDDTVAKVLDTLWAKKLFYVHPQRYGLGGTPYGRQEILDETASNLAAVLSWLNGERSDVFEKIVSDMGEIFESVRNLSVTNTSSGFEVRIWPTRERINPRLSHSLSTSGTGLAQALSILVAAATSDSSIMLIDEVNTFLHPGAAKSLMRILKSDYGSHQYIVSTHSAEIIGLGIASSIKFVSKVGQSSTVSQIDRNKLDELGDVANSLGISATDVFMHKKIVWVEGPTEEGCFDLIRRQYTPYPEDHIRFISVSSTGEFFSKKRDRELVLDIYRRLTKTMSPVTPSPVFCFDREGLSDDEVLDIRRRSQYKVVFLPRRNIESFLLIPEIIAALFERDYPEISEAGKAAAVEARMKELVSERKFGAGELWNNNLYEHNWLSMVDGAALLADLFNLISDTRVNYVKTRDSLALVSLALETRPEALKDLVDMVHTLEEKALKVDL